jgi:predicted alpha/beta-fold hydrolase
MPERLVSPPYRAHLAVMHAAHLDRLATNPDAEAEIVANAAARAAGILDIDTAALAKILGLSQAGAARRSTSDS